MRMPNKEPDRQDAAPLRDRVPHLQAIEDLGFLCEHDALAGIALIIAERRRRVERKLGITGGRPAQTLPELAGVDLAGAGALAAAHLDGLLREQDTTPIVDFRHD
jgi:hypothetical protein